MVTDNTNYSERAAKGQAYNLAVLTSIADGKHTDPKHVAKEFIRHYEIANKLQSMTIEEIKKRIMK